MAWSDQHPAPVTNEIADGLDALRFAASVIAGTLLFGAALLWLATRGL